MSWVISHRDKLSINNLPQSLNFVMYSFMQTPRAIIPQKWVLKRKSWWPGGQMTYFLWYDPRQGSGIICGWPLRYYQRMSPDLRFYVF